MPDQATPTAGEIEEAKHFPDGYVYRISRHFDQNGRVPGDAIEGAWKVNGEIEGQFIPNRKFDPDLRP